MPTDLLGMGRGPRQFLWHAARAGRKAILAQGRDVLFDIDYQGTQQVKREEPAWMSVTIFILPPSMSELQARLERRAEDPADTIARRLANARNEIRRWTQYDYVLVNDDIQVTFNDLLAIIEAERARTTRSKETIGVSSMDC